MRDEILYLRFLHIPGNPKLVLEPDHCKIGLWWKCTLLSLHLVRRHTFDWLFISISDVCLLEMLTAQDPFLQVAATFHFIVKSCEQLAGGKLRMFPSQPVYQILLSILWEGLVTRLPPIL